MAPIANAQLTAASHAEIICRRAVRKRTIGKSPPFRDPGRKRKKTMNA